MTTERASNESPPEELATCHGIIGHPEKAKFLAIRHNDGWLPPTVSFPSGSISYRAPMITDGIFRKYGLRTRFLRSLFSVHGYHCIELELVGGSARKLDAVWVGREEYERFRAITDRRVDPFAQWLDEQESGAEHPLRAPWQSPGWFETASHWIDHQLNRLQIQPTGSVEQFRVNWNASCVLRVPTSEGDIFFKASYHRPPREVELVEELVRAFPGSVPAPLALDAKRNWMLTRNYRESGRAPRDPEYFPRFARRLATIQVASATDIDRWRSLGCPVHDLDYLDAFLQARERWEPRLFEGGGRLHEDDAEDFAAVLERRRALVRRLAETGVPNALVHLDFRPDNFAIVDGNEVITDWADTVIGHPFLALDKIFLARQTTAMGEGPVTERMRVDGETLGKILSAYLEPFAGFAAAEQLREAMTLVRGLWKTWVFTRTVEHLDWVEPGSVRYMKMIVYLQEQARSVLEEGADPTG